MKRLRVKHTLTLEQRLAQEAQRFKDAAEKEQSGSKARELLLQHARQIERAVRINEWLTCSRQRNDREPVSRQRRVAN